MWERTGQNGRKDWGARNEGEIVAKKRTCEKWHKNKKGNICWGNEEGEEEMREKGMDKENGPRQKVRSNKIGIGMMD
jgi:hypothetical protein